MSTLRFAQRAKAIQNKAVVNEIMQDDVNVLREQIRLLKVAFDNSSVTTLKLLVILILQLMLIELCLTMPLIG